MRVLTDHLPELWAGIQVTLLITVIGFAGALVLGVLIAAARISPLPGLRLVGTAYVEAFQNIPLLVWLIIFVFALPVIGIIYPLVTTAIVVLILYHAAPVAEAVRTGVNTVAVGQGEAARALGFSTTQTLRKIVLPQALRAVIQPLGNIFIALTMNTALAAAVGVVELTAAANRVNLAEAQPIAVFVGSGLVYMVITLVVGLGAGVLERRVAIRR
jgi:glutamate transport system permease protein